MSVKLSKNRIAPREKLESDSVDDESVLGKQPRTKTRVCLLAVKNNQEIFSEAAELL